MCDALELLLLSILAPTIHCLWHLSSWEEAFITTVSVKLTEAIKDYILPNSVPLQFMFKLVERLAF